MKRLSHISITPKRRLIAWLWIIAILVLIAATTMPVEQTIPSASSGCYFCLGNGTEHNECYTSSGSGWTGCASGKMYCGYGGGNCSVELQ